MTGRRPDQLWRGRTCRRRDVAVCVVGVGRRPRYDGMTRAAAHRQRGLLPVGVVGGRRGVVGGVGAERFPSGATIDVRSESLS